MVKYCKCGCGKVVKNTWVLGHASRVHNNWGHNPTAIKKSAETRRAQYKSGERKVWNDGLTAKTDSRVANNGKQGSMAFTADRKKRYSKIMKENRLNGTIPTLYGKNSPHWKGGTSTLSQRINSSTKLYKEWKFPILKKANFKCKVCGSTKKLHVHHNKETLADIIKKFMDMNKVIEYHIDNNVSGIVLCREHHKQKHPFLNF